MRDTTKALIVISALFLAIIVTGCVQNSDNTITPVTGTQVTPDGTGTNGPGQSTGGHLQHNGTIGTPPAGQANQDQRSHALPNTTVLTQAAAKLGVSEQQLEKAMTSQEGVRQNLTLAAQQLNVSPQQLAEALGIPSGFQMQQHGNHTATIRENGS